MSEELKDLTIEESEPEPEPEPELSTWSLSLLPEPGARA